MKYDYGYDEYDDLYKHKVSDTVKWVLTLIAFLIVGVLLAGIICGWFTKNESTEEELPGEQQELPEEEGGMKVESSEVKKGISLMATKIAAADFASYGVSPLAESAQTVTARITPTDALNQEVDWSIAWANGSSAWANGKTVTDYVTIAPQSDGAKEATVSCLQPFGEQIIITATSRDNTDAKGTCTADYRQRYVDTETMLSFNNEKYYTLGSVSSSTERVTVANMPNKAQSGYNTNTDYSPTNPIYYTAVLSDTYTLPIEDKAVSYKYYLKLNPQLVTALKAEYSLFTDDNMATDWVLFDESSGSAAQAADKAHSGLASEETYNAIEFYYTLCNPLRTGVAQYVYCFQSTALGHFMRAAQTVSDYHFQIKVVAEYNGETHETVGSVKFNEASLTIPVQSVSVSNDLIF